MVSGLLHDRIIISIHVQVHHPPMGHAPRRDLGEQEHLYLLHGAGAGAGRTLRRLHAPRPHAPLGQHVPQRRQPHTAHEAQVPLPGQPLFRNALLCVYNTMLWTCPLFITIIYCYHNVLPDVYYCIS